MCVCVGASVSVHMPCVHMPCVRPCVRHTRACACAYACEHTCVRMCACASVGPAILWHMATVRKTLWRMATVRKTHCGAWHPYAKHTRHRWLVRLILLHGSCDACRSGNAPWILSTCSSRTPCRSALCSGMPTHTPAAFGLRHAPYVLYGLNILAEYPFDAHRPSVYLIHTGPLCLLGYLPAHLAICLPTLSTWLSACQGPRPRASLHTSIPHLTRTHL